MTAIARLCLIAGASVALGTAPTFAQKEATMHATGTFDVKLTPQTLSDGNADAALGRMSIAKQFHGDIEGTSTGEMLTARTAVDGSAGYVAIERVAATVGGRKGSFVLQHTGTMTRGAQQLSISIVPDSGTDALTGITGTMTIRIEGGTHYYDLSYSLR